MKIIEKKTKLKSDKIVRFILSRPLISKSRLATEVGLFRSQLISAITTIDNEEKKVYIPEKYHQFLEETLRKYGY